VSNVQFLPNMNRQITPLAPPGSRWAWTCVTPIASIPRCITAFSGRVRGFTRYEGFSHDT
jgi:hypothetical protein